MGQPNEKKNIVVGLLAHVDAGKTTLSEALLYQSGALRTMGRVDHGDAYLDTDAQERQRGITIFSKQALLTLGDTHITLLDTPGHADFSAEMERALQVLDCAILVISGTDGVQAHTRTLWRLLQRYEVPTFLFVNKMDLNGADRDALMEQLTRRLGSGCVDFTAPAHIRDEAAAMCDEAALEEFLAEGTLSQQRIAQLIASRKLYPCWFGSALKLEGIAEFLAALEHLTPTPAYGAEFGARVFKISREKNERLTWLKITGGTLRAKQLLHGGEGEAAWEEKADQLRLYSGTKYKVLEEADAGAVVAVTGLTHTRPGQGLGAETEETDTALEPVLNWVVRDRDERNEKMCALMAADGLPVSYAEMKRRFGEVIGRPHFADILVELGLASSVRDAFDRYVEKGQRYYVPRTILPIERAIEIIRLSGGVPVLAHPFQYKRDDAGLRELIEYCMEQGLRGMECRYSGYSPEQSTYLEALAEEYGLVKTGGSDFHGSNKPQIALGSGIMDNLSVPYEWLPQLKELAQK